MTGFAIIASGAGFLAQNALGNPGWGVGLVLFGVTSVRELKSLRLALGRWKQGWSVAQAGIPKRVLDVEVEAAYEIVDPDLSRYGWLLKVPDSWVLLEDSVEACAVMRLRDTKAFEHVRLIFWESKGYLQVVSLQWIGRGIESDAIISSVHLPSPGSRVGRFVELANPFVAEFLKSGIERVAESIWQGKSQALKTLWSRFDAS